MFVEEIMKDDITEGKEIGRGTFGIVVLARYNNSIVAVKKIDPLKSADIFAKEVRQLSRVCHENIVKFYGICKDVKYPVLVMEYCDCGSLYNLLHLTKHSFTNAHAISWCLQCARGVAYLHGMLPLAVIHRDLKSGNLLLVDSGRKLKICDFGTACDQRTEMTNNTGSAAWMAPEVFEGKSYTQKCDVYSFGILLWEIFHRKRPFQAKNGAMAILWAVTTNNERPEISETILEVFAKMMKICWDRNVATRPTMADVTVQLEILFQGHETESNLPIMTPEPIEDILDDDSEPCASPTTCIQESDLSGKVVTVLPTATWLDVRNVVDSKMRPKSADTTHLVESVEAMSVTTSTTLKSNQTNPINRRSSHHRRTASQGSSNSFTTQNTPRPVGDIYTNSDSAIIPTGMDQQQKSVSLDQLGPIPPEDSSSKPPYFRQNAVQTPSNIFPSSDNTGPGYASDDDFAFMMSTLDEELQPIQPVTTDESCHIFNEHIKMVKEYLEVQTEIIMLLHQQKSLMQEVTDLREEKCDKEGIAQYQELVKQNESLKVYHTNLKRERDEKLAKSY